MSFGALMGRRALSVKNTLGSYTGYEWTRNTLFGLAGLALLFGLHVGFHKLLLYLSTVELIGRLITWKLTAMLMLMTFSMVTVSSLLTALTTLFYSYDLKFLMKAPVSLRAVFLDKSLESAFFASWTIGLVLVPYALALMRVEGLGGGFLAAFAVSVPPFLLLAASWGIGFTLVLLWLFPSSRTRDVVWVLSSLSLTVTYGLVRFAQPERLIRPDALKVVAEYLNFLQAPTAPYLPSWWLSEGLRLAAEGAWRGWALRCAALWGAAALVYAALVALAGRLYFDGYSGAQEGALRRRVHAFLRLPENALLGKGPLAGLLWKERVAFFRDVKHWSQILLIIGLVFVYLFSIRRLPLDSPDLRSLLSFLNIGTAGFVLAALGLRFTFPAVSLEGRSWWVTRSAPVTIGQLMRQKFLFSAIPTLAVALTLGVMTNGILSADRFTGWLSLGALTLIALAITAMGVGLGALFPRFTVENIHQIESSVGGFVYMAACLFYVGASVSILALPMRMHFAQRFGMGGWDWRVAGVAAALLLLLNAAAFTVPWALGARNLEAHEE
jgi:ABC-2 type transport system permease protein